MIPEGKEGSLHPRLLPSVSTDEAVVGFVTLEVLRETVDLGQHYYGGMCPRTSAR